MDSIKLGDEEFPVRWDFLALKEYKQLAKNDAIANFETTTENISTLVWAGIKGGYRLKGDKFDFTQDQIAAKILPRDMKPIMKVFAYQCGTDEVPGEVMPSLKGA